MSDDENTPEPSSSSSAGDVETFEATGSGASLSTPLQSSACRKGGFILIKGDSFYHLSATSTIRLSPPPSSSHVTADRPCKIVEMSSSKTGKHGHAKVHIVAIDIFTGKKLEELCPSSHNVNVPYVSRRDYQLLDITEEGFLSLLGDANATKDDLKLPPDEKLAADLKAAFGSGNDKEILVSVVKSMGEEMVVAFKEGSVK